MFLLAADFRTLRHVRASRPLNSMAFPHDSRAPPLIFEQPIPNNVYSCTEYMYTRDIDLRPHRPWIGGRSGDKRPPKKVPEVPFLRLLWEFSVLRIETRTECTVKLQNLLIALISSLQGRCEGGRAGGEGARGGD